MHADANFWDKIADRYARRPVADEAAYQRKLAITREYLRPQSRVLEFGCGTGSTAIVHAPRVAHIDALDISARMLEIGRERARQAGVDNIHFQQADLLELDAPDGSYDVVLGLSILHLLEDPAAAIRRAHALLADGGVFVSSTACLGSSWYRVFRYLAPIGRLFGWLPGLRVFSPRQLEAMLQDAGFVIEQRWQPGNGPVLFVVARK